ncbi:penicillin-binding protein 1C [Pseudooceanicola sp. 216_PA32_1]|uniref:peptidoglycan glycosyltransferase n=1 Tax=Pseudooceanicola pacificus TaxID=2676438 RepID=A0A844W091_9RHOB|nr:penicillin-binding protein 1C [Pseudooceanicola pacificus]MWB76525.1 penicillin-binding protein 1C [Pseudooceanicola pacificus]
MSSTSRALLALTLALGLGAAARDAFDDWIDRTELPPLVAETSVEMRDRDGALLRAYTVADGRWRLNVGTDQVDPLFLRMLMAYEDKRFASHHGVDPRAVIRAAWQAVWNGGIVSGGSTLTMQVARLIEESGTGRWSGKLRQARVALALERRLSKERILDLYLTHAPYGGNLEGLRSATYAWFGKEPGRLTPAEAALLIALPQSPEARRPDRDRDAARAARDRVLERAANAGAITAEAATAALHDPVPYARRPFPALAPHLTDRALAEAPDLPRHDLTVRAALQAKLERLARDTLRGKAPRLSVAIVAADHRTGEILASVGSAGYDMGAQREGYVDMTRALRSPGSTLKPLVYGLAFDAGLAHPETLISDRPVAFGSYAPQNFDGMFRGELRVAEALRLSLNIPVVLLTDALGPENLMAGLRRAGVRADVPGGKPGLAVALGGVGVTLEDLVTLYAGLAEGGMARPLSWRMTGGETVRQRRVISRAAAWQVGHILAGMAPPVGAPRNRLAYKTGTSYGHRDAWAIGFDGDHVIGVWIGRPDGTPVPGAFGAEVAAPVLFEAFQRLKADLAPLPPPPPETLLVGASLLPEPLKRFRARDAVFVADPRAPVLAFPPDGAVLSVRDGQMPARVNEGRPPFTWLANGRPLATGIRARSVLLDGLGTGFADISVIDAAGRSARVSVRIE